jgi:transposase
MSYRIAGIDVHKKVMAVVIADVEVEGEYQFERRLFSSSPDNLRLLAEWLIQQEVEEAVMESTAQYWEPLWGALERYWKPICQKRKSAGPTSGTLHLAQAQSNRGRRGRKKDFPDAERLVKRLLANELILSFVPDVEQRLWRTVMRRKHQMTCNRVQLQNRLESLLEEAHIKLSSLVSDLLGVSARRMLKALAEGETKPTALAAMADKKLRATQAQLCDALGACTELNPVYRHLLKMTLEELQLIEQQISLLDQEMVRLLGQHQDAVKRLAEVPGLGADSAQQIIAEVGATAATFRISTSPRGWEHVQETTRVQAYLRITARRRAIAKCGGFYKQAIGAIAHRLCRLVWLILHKGVRYEERGPSVSQQSRKRRTARMIRELRLLGYRVVELAPPVANPAEA